MLIVFDHQLARAGDRQIDRVFLAAAAVMPLIDAQLSVQIESDTIVSSCKKAI
jgi:hypothetical protein